MKAATKLKTVYERFEELFGRNNTNSAKMACFKAYIDCQDGVDSDERNLDFFCKEAFTAVEIKMIVPLIIPGGYNAFDSVKSIEALTDFFGDDADYFIARESSVCIYVKPRSGNVWLAGRRAPNLDADEFLFDASLGMFRVWWD